MKFISLEIHNIGIIADCKVEFNKPLILFYGEIRQGKSTILNCVRWVLGGAFPSDIIKHGKNDASIILKHDTGIITRSWYRAKDLSTKARDVDFTLNGAPVKSPVTEIRKLLNPFLIDQDHLTRMGEADRKAYFSELFGVDTKELDIESGNLEREARDLRIAIKSYGEIDTTPIVPVDVEALKNELTKERRNYSAIASAAEVDNVAIRNHNSTIDRGNEKLKALDKDISEYESKLVALHEERKKVSGWIEKNPRKAEVLRPSEPDTSELESKISQAAANQVRFEQYQGNLQRAKEKQSSQESLSSKEKRQSEIKKEKLAKLKVVSDDCGIVGLSFDESGNFVYQGTTASMLSTSQIMRLSSELSSLYPEGFGIDLIDRGESLGKSIFEFVEKAKTENKTILAAIVGERPAKVPENVGVFVVQNGELK